MAQEVLIVEAEFLQTGPSDIGELDLHFLRGAAGLAAFGDILYAAPGCLHHLVMSTAIAADVGVAESDGDIIAQLCDLKGFQVFVSTEFRE